MATMVNDGKNISPLFGCPGLSLECVCIGALHCMDLGISQDIIGCIFWEAILHLEIGRIRKAKCTSLWMKLKKYYKQNKVKSRVQCLYLGMIKKKGETPKLKCKGAKTRHMVTNARERLPNNFMQNFNPAISNGCWTLPKCWRTSTVAWTPTGTVTRLPVCHRTWA